MDENILSKLRESVDFFAELSLAEIDSVLRRSTRKLLKKDETIFQDGSIGNEMYLILKGTVRLVKSNNPSTAAILLGYGQYFGELGLLTHKPRTFSAIADQDGTLLIILNEYQMTRNYALAYRFFKQISYELSERTRALNDLYLAKKRSLEEVQARNNARYHKIYKERVPIKDVDFENCSLSSSAFGGTSFWESCFVGAEFNGCRLEKNSYVHADFCSADFSKTSFRNAKFHDSNFCSSDFQQVVFENCVFKDIDFSTVDCEKTTFNQS